MHFDCGPRSKKIWVKNCADAKTRLIKAEGLKLLSCPLAAKQLVSRWKRLCVRHFNSFDISYRKWQMARWAECRSFPRQIPKVSSGTGGKDDGQQHVLCLFFFLLLLFLWMCVWKRKRRAESGGLVCKSIQDGSTLRSWLGSFIIDLSETSPLVSSRLLSSHSFSHMRVNTENFRKFGKELEQRARLFYDLRGGRRAERSSGGRMHTSLESKGLWYERNGKG